MTRSSPSPSALPFARAVARVCACACALASAACGPRTTIEPRPAGALTVRAEARVDSAPKSDLRMVPPEAYMRTYLTLFGGLAPLEAQKRARGGDGAQLFDTWDDYFSALGFPDYRLDLPRAGETNALMVATFERLGVALCDRAVEHDFGAGKAKAEPPVGQKAVFAFESPPGGWTKVGAAEFTPRFDVLHRTFLGYPARLAPTDRTARFFALYEDVVRRHRAPGAPRSRFSPEEAGWAAVCYGLVRHPEFQLY